MEAFRYKNDPKGWAALGLGPWMTGALMFILYGDPTAPGAPVTVSIRSATGHHPPVALSAEPAPYVPVVDVTYAHFDEYVGGFDHADMGKPSHMAVADFIVRGYDQWKGVDVSNTSSNQAFIWSSNFKQDFEGDYGTERHIDMHMFGLGFGFLFIDLNNAAVPNPFYGEIRDTEGHAGINEIADPDPPTAEELARGDDDIARLAKTADTPPQPPPSPAATATAVASTESNPPLKPETAAHPQTTEQKPKPMNSVRNWLWHIHGSLMILAFLILYPLGTYLLRSPRATAFNYHWTIQCLGTFSVLIGAVVGYMTSHGISITHQYAGFAITGALVAQVVLGWRHHVFFVQTKRKNWLSPAHMWLGRIVLPVGFVNIFTGLKLRGYGWLTILLVVAVMLIEILFLFWYIRGASQRNARIDSGAGKVGGMRQGGSVEAAEEEYFQLAGDDDDGEFSDEEEERERKAVQERAEERRKREERLGEIDKA